MPDTIHCVECETALLSFTVDEEDPKPIGSDECPICEGTEFEVRD